MDPLSGKVAIVTGASSGIGAAIAKALVLIGVHVIAVARRQGNLKKIGEGLKDAPGSYHPFPADLRREEDILNVFRYADAQFRGIDILVNVAGVAIPERIITGSTEAFRNTLDVNLLAPAITTREAVKAIRKRGGSGHIINIISAAATNPLIATPFSASLYEASKAGIAAMTEKVRAEIRVSKDPIKISAIYPGFTRTEIFGKGAFNSLIELAIPLLEPEDIADAVLYALRAPRNVQLKSVYLNMLVELWIERSHKILLAIMYRAPQTGNLHHFESDFAERWTNYRSCIVLEDLNIDGIECLRELGLWVL